MMDIAIQTLITLLTYSFMEFMAWFSHKYIMHGFFLETSQRSSSARKRMV